MKLLLLNLKTTFFRLIEWFRVSLFYYWRRPVFIWIDLLMVSQYLLRSPHRISKAYNIKRGEKNIYTFGETPLTTLDSIAKQSRILSKDIVYELGCGSGRTCFWLRTFVRCRVIGIDFLPTFIQKANRVKKWSSLTDIEFKNEDMLKTALQKATVIYLYGTCLEDEIIEQLIERFEILRPKTKVITVSYPLTEFSKRPLFKVTKQFTARFPWGEAEVFVNQKLS